MTDWIQAHPIEAAVLAANAIVNGLRMAYPDNRPKWVLFLLGCIDPVALNLWSPVKRLQGK